MKSADVETKNSSPSPRRYSFLRRNVGHLAFVGVSTALIVSGLSGNHEARENLTACSQKLSGLQEAPSSTTSSELDKAITSELANHNFSESYYQNLVQARLEITHRQWQWDSARNWCLDHDPLDFPDNTHAYQAILGILGLVYKAGRKMV